MLNVFKIQPANFRKNNNYKTYMLVGECFKNQNLITKKNTSALANLAILV